MRLVVLATSAFQGGPGGWEEGSGLKVMLESVIVMLPAEPVFKSPVTTAEATEVGKTATRTATTKNSRLTGRDIDPPPEFEPGQIYSSMATLSNAPTLTSMACHIRRLPVFVDRGRNWLGGRESNPNSLVQSQLSY